MSHAAGPASSGPLSPGSAMSSGPLSPGSAVPAPVVADPVALLPHAPPFRFVDSVDELRPAEHVRARYRVTGEEAFLAGHFPGNPVFPGVIQLEALAQAGAVALLADGRFAGALPLFGGVDEVRFRRQVVPGDEMVLTVDVEQLSRRAGRARGTATVDGSVACSARLLFVLV